MYVFITPIIKTKGGNFNNLDNYRPIALSNIISKVFEQIIIDKISKCIYV